MATRKKRKAKTRTRAFFVKAGRKGGKVGGRRRAEALTPERRSEIAREAAAKRWGKSKTPESGA